jgi:hypothetical protein
MLGLPFAFASHFAPDAPKPTLEIYRVRFGPSGKPWRVFEPARAAREEMTYELAKQLKDERFPQGGNGSWIGPPSNLVWRAAKESMFPLSKNSWRLVAISKLSRTSALRPATNGWQAHLMPRAPSTREVLLRPKP